MKNFKICFVLFFCFFLTKTNAQTLTATGNHKITGTWTFENGITVKGGKSFLTDGLNHFH